MKRKRAFLSVKRRNSIAGLLYVSPFLFGFLLFFLTPMVSSFRNSFSIIEMQKTKQITTWVGLRNYGDLIFKNAEYLPLLTGYFRALAYQLPIVLVFSLFIGLILKQKFHGRTIARAVFFFPVIVSSGVVISILGNDLTNQSLRQNTTIFITNNKVLTDLLIEARVGAPVISFLLRTVETIFDLTWKSGVQILLFLAALMSIPDSFYEAGSIEGASGWVTFWKITFPMITPYILVCLVLTIVDSFTDYNNPLINYIYAEIRNINYGPSSAMAWVYTVSVFILMSVIIGLVSGKVFYMAD